MGLLDILNGMQNGPRGQSDPNAKGGMSPMTMAILALLAYKAYQKVGSSGQAIPSPGGTTPNAAPSSGGGLGDLLNGGLGDLLVAALAPLARHRAKSQAQDNRVGSMIC